ncbi:hypothetical protein Pve01_38080 [Planomonospora venezuelensis]|uniref:Uncharacterized protein n=1 Tax=Planomonospora venezuelensis TaxID=1999 RepID=A0A841D449_PLAVE|nr:hypothetical protein [Planomonospora venezuelensis]GIN02150.1 hypothetical protein Pve01_38080 [Planomonospora venezuelensis]
MRRDRGAAAPVHAVQQRGRRGYFRAIAAASGPARRWSAPLEDPGEEAEDGEAARRAGEGAGEGAAGGTLRSRAAGAL